MESRTRRLRWPLGLAAVAAVLSTVAAGGSQPGDDPENALVEKEFVVLRAGAEYVPAVDRARSVASSLELHLDLRGLGPDAVDGLTLSPEECEENGWGHPCYVPRGRWDDGVWVSVELSNAFAGQEKREYLIVLAGAPPDDPMLEAVLSRARSGGLEPETLRAQVYLGCIH